MTSQKSVIIPFMLGGCAASMALPVLTEGKEGFGTAGNAGVAVAVVVLLLWNVSMYRKAQAVAEDEAEERESALVRYLSPVAATASFVVGFLLFLF